MNRNYSTNQTDQSDSIIKVSREAMSIQRMEDSIVKNQQLFDHQTNLSNQSFGPCSTNYQLEAQVDPLISTLNQLIASARPTDMPNAMQTAQGARYRENIASQNDQSDTSSIQIMHFPSDVNSQSRIAMPITNLENNCQGPPIQSSFQDLIPSGMFNQKQRILTETDRDIFDLAIPHTKGSLNQLNDQRFRKDRNLAAEDRRHLPKDETGYRIANPLLSNRKYQALQKQTQIQTIWNQQIQEQISLPRELPVPENFNNIAILLKKQGIRKHRHYSRKDQEQCPESIFFFGAIGGTRRGARGFSAAAAKEFKAHRKAVLFQQFQSINMMQDHKDDSRQGLNNSRRDQPNTLRQIQNNADQQSSSMAVTANPQQSQAVATQDNQAQLVERGSSETNISKFACQQKNQECSAADATSVNESSGTNQHQRERTLTQTYPDDGPCCERQSIRQLNNQNHSINGALQPRLQNASAEPQVIGKTVGAFFRPVSVTRADTFLQNCDPLPSQLAGRIHSTHPGDEGFSLRGNRIQGDSSSSLPSHTLLDRKSITSQGLMIKVLHPAPICSSTAPSFQQSTLPPPNIGTLGKTNLYLPTFKVIQEHIAKDSGGPSISNPHALGNGGCSETWNPFDHIQIQHPSISYAPNSFTQQPSSCQPRAISQLYRIHPKSTSNLLEELQVASSTLSRRGSQTYDTMIPNSVVFIDGAAAPPTSSFGKHSQKPLVCRSSSSEIQPIAESQIITNRVGLSNMVDAHHLTKFGEQDQSIEQSRIFEANPKQLQSLLVPTLAASNTSTTLAKDQQENASYLTQRNYQRGFTPLVAALQQARIQSVGYQQVGDLSLYPQNRTLDQVQTPNHILSHRIFERAEQLCPSFNQNTTVVGDIATSIKSNDLLKQEQKFDFTSSYHLMPPPLGLPASVLSGAAHNFVRKNPDIFSSMSLPTLAATGSSLNVSEEPCRSAALENNLANTTKNSLLGKKRLAPNESLDLYASVQHHLNSPLMELLGSKQQLQQQQQQPMMLSTLGPLSQQVNSFMRDHRFSFSQNQSSGNLASGDFNQPRKVESSPLPNIFQTASFPVASVDRNNAQLSDSRVTASSFKNGTYCGGGISSQQLMEKLSSLSHLQSQNNNSFRPAHKESSSTFDFTQFFPANQQAAAGEAASSGKCFVGSNVSAIGKNSHDELQKLGESNGRKRLLKEEEKSSFYSRQNISPHGTDQEYQSVGASTLKGSINQQYAALLQSDYQYVREALNLSPEQQLIGKHGSEIDLRKCKCLSKVPHSRNFTRIKYTNAITDRKMCVFVCHEKLDPHNHHENLHEASSHFMSRGNSFFGSSHSNNIHGCSTSHNQGRINSYTTISEERCCRKIFRKWHNLFDHLRTHTGERPFPCPVYGCNDAFKQYSNQLKHLLTHRQAPGLLSRSMQHALQYTTSTADGAINTLHENAHSIEESQELLMLPCKICRMEFPRFRLLQHFNTSHPPHNNPMDFGPLSKISGGVPDQIHSPTDDFSHHSE